MKRYSRTIGTREWSDDEELGNDRDELSVEQLNVTGLYTHTKRLRFEATQTESKGDSSDKGSDSFVLRNLKKFTSFFFGDNKSAEKDMNRNNKIFKSSNSSRVNPQQLPPAFVSNRLSKGNSDTRTVMTSPNNTPVNVLLIPKESVIIQSFPNDNVYYIINEPHNSSSITSPQMHHSVAIPSMNLSITGTDSMGSCIGAEQFIKCDICGQNRFDRNSMRCLYCKRRFNEPKLLKSPDMVTNNVSPIPTQVFYSPKYTNSTPTNGQSNRHLNKAHILGHMMSPKQLYRDDPPPVITVPDEDESVGQTSLHLSDAKSPEHKVIVVPITVEKNHSDDEVTDIGIQCDPSNEGNSNRISREAAIESTKTVNHRELNRSSSIELIPAKNRKYNIPVKCDNFKVNPECVMFGSFKAEIKSFEMTYDELKFMSVAPNKLSATFKFHIKIPINEIREMKVCNDPTICAILIQPIEESARKIRESMELDINTSRGYAYNPNSLNVGLRWIIVVLPHWSDIIDSIIRRSFIGNEKIVSVSKCEYVQSAYQQSLKLQREVLRGASSVTPHEIPCKPKVQVILNEYARNAIRPKLNDGREKGNSNPYSNRSVIKKNSNETVIDIIDDDDDDDVNDVTIKNATNSNEESETNRRKTKIKSNPLILMYPSHEEKFKISLFANDYQCLNDGEFLNDNIVHFYLKYIINELIPPEIANKTHIFDPLFSSKLLDNNNKGRRDSNVSLQQRCYNKVRQFIRSIDISEKDFLVVPVVKDHHWWLAIICYHYKVPNSDDPQIIDESDMKRPCIIFFDSMTHTKLMFKNACTKLRDFLISDWNERRDTRKSFDKTTLPDYYPHVPKQTNGSDCGLYVLEFVEKFLNDPDFVINKGAKGDLDKWFDPEDIAKNKRNHIMNLILARVEPDTANSLREQYTCIKVDDDSEEKLEITDPQMDTETEKTKEPPTVATHSGEGDVKKDDDNDDMKVDDDVNGMKDEDTDKDASITTHIQKSPNYPGDDIPDDIGAVFSDSSQSMETDSDNNGKTPPEHAFKVTGEDIEVLPHDDQ